MKGSPNSYFKRTKWHLLLLIVMVHSVAIAATGDPLAGWPVLTGETIFSAPAVGPHGEIVFGTKTGDVDLPEGPGGNVYSYHPNGLRKWKFAGTDWFESSPAIAPDGTVYIGGWDNFLYAINGQNGTKIWQFQTESAITAPPAIGPDETVYVGSTDGRMYAVWPTGPIRLRWEYETDPDLLSPIYGGAVFNHAGTVLYFGDADGTLHAVNASTGAGLWTYTVPPEHDLFINPGARSISASPALDSLGNIYFTCENGYLYMLNPSGILKNAFGTSDSILSSPVVDSLDRVYVSSRDTYLYCLDIDNTGVLDSIWDTYVGDVLYSTPAMDELENIFVAGYTGDLTGIATTFSLLTSSGEVVWSNSVATLNDSSPNMAPDGSICIGTYDGKMHRLAGMAPLSISGWPRQSANRRQTGWSADLPFLDLVDYFPEIEYDLADLSYVRWYGFGYIKAAALPIISHMEHGLVYVAESGPHGIIVYDYRLQRWLFAYRAYPNYYLDMDSRKWLYHAEGTSVEYERWFYDFSLADWLPESALW